MWFSFKGSNDILSMMQKDIQCQSHFPPKQQSLQPDQKQGQILYQPRNIAAGQGHIQPMGMTQRFNQYPQQPYVNKNMYAQVRLCQYHSLIT